MTERRRRQRNFGRDEVTSNNNAIGDINLAFSTEEGYKYTKKLLL